MYSREEALEKYRRLVADVDALTTNLSACYRPYMVCRPGCWECCRHSLAVFPLEAVFLDRAIRGLTMTVRDALAEQYRTWLLDAMGEEPDVCPLLLQGTCAVYKKRPIICRTQGYPLWVEGEKGSFADACPLNFTTEEARLALSPERMVPLEEINIQLAIANLHFCRAQGITDAASGQRIPLRSLLQSVL
jgi:uncharacterized protein